MQDWVFTLGFLPILPTYEFKNVAKKESSTKQIFNPFILQETEIKFLMVPERMVGLIIGRGGEQIQSLEAESGCKIHMARSRGNLDELVK